MLEDEIKEAIDQQSTGFVVLAQGSGSYCFDKVQVLCGNVTRRRGSFDRTHT
jgi:hypothetical protein